MAAQFPQSTQMHKLSEHAAELIETRSHTVVGKGTNPVLPNSLTLRQAEALAQLAPKRTNIEIAMRLGTTESAVKKRLQGAFRKIDVTERHAAERWASENL
jgi:DNA-binding NarL/FixJ family response regulator